MPEATEHRDGEMLHSSVRNEPTDVRFGLIFNIIFGSMAFAAVTFVLVMVFFQSERAAVNKASRSPFPLATQPSRALPAKPRLEPLDRLEEVTSSNVYLREQARLEQLNSLGITKEKGFVHVPIKRAMQMLANKLPVRGEPAAERGVAAEVFGMLGSPVASAPLRAAASVFPAKDRLIQGALPPRDNGLVDGGESNSGRMFNRRKPPWYGQ